MMSDSLTYTFRNFQKMSSRLFYGLAIVAILPCLVYHVCVLAISPHRSLFSHGIQGVSILVVTFTIPAIAGILLWVIGSRSFRGSIPNGVEDISEVSGLSNVRRFICTVVTTLVMVIAWWFLDAWSLGKSTQYFWSGIYGDGEYGSTRMVGFHAAPALLLCVIVYLRLTRLGKD